MAAPLVDGNVMRVFSRWFGIGEDIALGSTQRVFWAIASEWVMGARPGDLNQALMEPRRDGLHPGARGATPVWSPTRALRGAKAPSRSCP